MTDTARAARDKLYLEDLAPGQTYRTGEITVDAEAIRRFAAAFDPQPFHLDDAAARETPLGGLAASGWHTAALTMRLLAEGGLPIAGGILGAGGEIAWPQPARPNDVLRVESEVVAIRPSRSRPDRGMVTVRSDTRNQHGELLQTLVAKLVVPRRQNAERRAADEPQAS